MKNLYLLAILGMLVGFQGQPGAQEVPVPVALQFALFAKIATFDRNLDTSGERELVIGVVYQSRYRNSLTVADACGPAMAAASQEGQLRFRRVPIDLSASADLAGAIAGQQIDLLYLAPLRAVEIDRLVGVSRAHRIRTLTGVPEYVERGVGVGIGMKGERPQILVNLEAARAEGADFGAPLLKLAKIVE
jgi:hypothetical protein